MADKASSMTLYPVFNKFQKRSTGKNPSKSNRNITELEKHDIWEEKRKTRMNWSSAKRRESKGHDGNFQIHESLLQGKSEESVLHAHNFQKKKQKGLKSNKEDLGKHYWVEWQRGCGVRALGKKESKTPSQNY